MTFLVGVQQNRLMKRPKHLQYGIYRTVWVVSQVIHYKPGAIGNQIHVF